MRRGAAASRRRATAWPTSPLPPRIIAVRSRSSMQSLDGLDLASREPPVFPCRPTPAPHRPVGYAVQPLDLEPQRLGQPAHASLAPPARRDLPPGAPPH